MSKLISSADSSGDAGDDKQRSVDTDNDDEFWALAGDELSALFEEVRAYLHSNTLSIRLLDAEDHG